MLLPPVSAPQTEHIHVPPDCSAGSEEVRDNGYLGDQTQPLKAVSEGRDLGRQGRGQIYTWYAHAMVTRATTCFSLLQPPVCPIDGGVANNAAYWRGLTSDSVGDNPSGCRLSAEATEPSLLS